MYPSSAQAKTIHVDHLGGTDVGYRLSDNYDASKPTLVLVIPFTTTTEYYTPEFENKDLTSKINLLALEPLGHGKTVSKVENFTYWDSAIIFLKAMNALGVDKAFALGTSQGGWICARMALLASERIQGIILVGSSMDYESPRSRELGCWDGPTNTSGFVTMAGNLDPVPDFEPGNDYYDFLIDIGYGKDVDEEMRNYWRRTVKNNYLGDTGKRRICMAALNLSDRDGLHSRLPHILCPVLWLQGTADVVFSVANAQEEIKLFQNSPDARLVTFEGGQHFLSYTHQDKVHGHILEFVEKYKGSEDYQKQSIRSGKL